MLSPIERNLAKLMSVPERVPEIIALYRRPVLQLQHESTAITANSLAYSACARELQFDLGMPVAAR